MSKEEIDAEDIEALKLLLDTEESNRLGDLWPDENERRERAKAIGCEAIIDGPPYPSITLMEKQNAIDNYPYTPEVIEEMIKEIDRQTWIWSGKVWLTKHLPVVLLLLYVIIYL
tara:strand:- start:712 stop:1053 length:342 start_codon:yes stop_codon:yes gene_type:complete